MIRTRLSQCVWCSLQAMYAASGWYSTCLPGYELFRWNTGATDWIYKWQNNGWTASSGRQVENRDLLEKLDDLRSRGMQVNWVRLDGTKQTNKTFSGQAKCPSEREWWTLHQHHEWTTLSRLLFWSDNGQALSWKGPSFLASLSCHCDHLFWSPCTLGAGKTTLTQVFVSQNCVHGHAGDEGNEEADQLAREGARSSNWR